MGVSFAIPINVALEVSEQLKDSGRVSRGWLGVLIQEVNKDLAESFGLSKAAGALVAQVMPDGPASKSDLRSGDVITHLDGKPIVLSSDLPQLIGRVQPGSKVTLQVMRNGKKKRSEERRVGKECRSRWSREHEKKKKDKTNVYSTYVK